MVLAGHTTVAWLRQSQSYSYCKVLTFAAAESQESRRRAWSRALNRISLEKYSILARRRLEGLAPHWDDVEVFVLQLLGGFRG